MRFKLAALLVALVSMATATGFLMAPWLRQSDKTSAPQEDSALFRNWPKPDVALVLTGEEHGYLQPCGCSNPQLGGLARRYNFVQSLKKRGWPIVSANLGDVTDLPQRKTPQTLLKYRVFMQGLELLDTTAVGVGECEMVLPFFQAMGEFALNHPSPPHVLAANLKEKDNVFRDQNAYRSWDIAGGKAGVPKVGLVSVIGESVAKKVQDDDLSFEKVEKVLPGVLRELQQQKPELLVLLYQGSLDEAKTCAGKFPHFHVILCLSTEPDASSVPEQVGNTWIISVGHKGRRIGVVGVSRTKDPQRPLELRYEYVALGPEYETPEGQDKHNPLHGLMEDYAREVKEKDYLAQYIQMKHPLQVDYPEARYVGSEKCKKCHELAYTIWDESAHRHAHDTLVHKAKRPSNRQFDGECIVCHVTGFGYKTGFTKEKDTPHLKDVGCESCHGPGSLHVKDQNNKQFQAALNPWRRKPGGEDPKVLANRIDQMCVTCHDLDNSVHFKFEEYWIKKKIIHNAGGE
jgi:hypothetical protein